MIAETGHYALILAPAVATVQTVLPIWGARPHRPGASWPSPFLPPRCELLLIALAFARR